MNCYMELINQRGNKVIEYIVVSHIDHHLHHQNLKMQSKKNNNIEAVHGNTWFSVIVIHDFIYVLQCY